MDATVKSTSVQAPTDLMVKTEQLLYLRLAVAAAGLCLCLCIWLFGIYAFEIQSSSLTILFVLAYSGIGLALITTRRLSTRIHLNRLNAGLTVLDVSSLTLLVHFTYGLESDLYVLYLLPILLASYISSYRGTYLAALVVSMSYVGLVVVENASSLTYLFQSDDSYQLAHVYAGKLWGKILGRSLLLVSVAFLWARFCAYMSDVAQQGANRLREQLDKNNRMVYEIQTKAQREKLINSINSAVRSTLEFDKVLATAAVELAGAVGGYRCAIVCRMSEKDSSKRIICEANSAGDSRTSDGDDLAYFDATICDFFLNRKAHYESKNDDSIVKTFVFPAPADEPAFAPVKDKLAKAGYGSLVVQPMIYADKSKGVIVLAEVDPRRDWSESDLELVKSVAGQVAVAVEQASLIEELEHKNEDLVQKNLNLDTKNSELRTMQSQLIHQEKMASLGRLVAGIAHELNNPINFVHGNLPYLKEYVEDMKTLIDSIDFLPDEEKKSLDELKEKVKYEFLVTDLDNIIADLNEGAERIRHIIKNLRSFSRLDEAELKDAQIHDDIDSTLKILSQYYGREKIPVVRDFGDIPTVLCYPGQLNQVWMNLLSNAAQALEQTESPQVTIRTQADDNNVTVSVIDNGPGIEPEIQSKIFDPFYTTKPVGQGTGLGLSICHSIMERHGGRIELDSDPGKGAAFTVTIPIHRKEVDLEQYAGERRSIYDT